MVIKVCSVVIEHLVLRRLMVEPIHAFLLLKLTSSIGHLLVESMFGCQFLMVSVQF